MGHSQLLENCCVPRQMRETRSDVPGSTIISMSRRLLGAGCRSTYLLRASVARSVLTRRVLPMLPPAALIRDSFDSCGDTRHFAFRRSAPPRTKKSSLGFSGCIARTLGAVLARSAMRL